MTAPATAVFIAFRTASIDLEWIADDADVIIVHNDDTLDERSCVHPRVRHVRSGTNLGFGAGVNAALELVRTERVVVCNPDTRLGRAQWMSLAAPCSADEILTVAQVDGEGRATSVVNRYPTPLTLALTGYRVGRLLRRGSALRRRLEPLLGRWGAEHATLRETAAGSWPLAEYWVSGALFSADVARLRAIGGFDSSFFLYVEDVDLCRRLDQRFPGMGIRMVGGDPGVHLVGGSAASRADRIAVDRHHLASVRRYGRAQRGLGWRLVGAALTPRAAMLARRG